MICIVTCKSVLHTLGSVVHDTANIETDEEYAWLHVVLKKKHCQTLQTRKPKKWSFSRFQLPGSDWENFGVLPWSVIGGFANEKLRSGRIWKFGCKRSKILCNFHHFGKENNVVQNRQAGEQKSHWDKTNKRHT